MRERFLVLCVFLLFPAVLPCPASAGGPLDQARETTDKILAILKDPGMKDASKAQEKKALIGKVVDERFDWEELSRRSLGRHWANRTEEERRAFVTLFRELLERTYLDRVEEYSGEQISYVGEKVDGDFATVEAKFLTAQRTEIPLLYRMRLKGDAWMFYDVVIEGVSLVGNYRNQFQSILSRRPYEELVRMLQEKVAEEQ